MLTTHGINKPVFYAYQFANRLGNTELTNNDFASWVCKDNNVNLQALLWDFTNTHPGDSVNNQVYYVRDLPAKSKGKVKLNIAQLPEGKYPLEIYRVGYRSNDAFSTYLSMGKPSQLTRQQVDYIKKQNSGAPMSSEVISIVKSKPFIREVDMRENDVFFVNLIRL